MMSTGFDRGFHLLSCFYFSYYTNYPLPGKKTKRRSMLLGGWGSYKKKRMAEALLYFSDNFPLRCFIGMTNCPYGTSVHKSPAAGLGAHTLHHLVTACLAQASRQLQITLGSWRPRPDLFRGRVRFFPACLSAVSGSGCWISGSAGSFGSKLLKRFNFSWRKWILILW